MDLGLEGKTAIVVGAGADVGRAAALALARERVRVILVGRRREPLEDTAVLVQAAGGKAHVLPGNLGESTSVRRIVEEAQSVTGSIDLLANTAGPFPMVGADANGLGPMYGNDASWSQAFDGVFMTAARLAREVMPLMKARGSGAVVHLGANSARYYNPMTAQFGAMKAALVHAVKNWARDGIKHGVRVNAVLPGWIKGERIAQRLRSGAASAAAPIEQVEQDMITGHDKLYWMPRMGRPEEYADAIVFLLSERASYINGALIPVDGGSPVW